MDTVNIKLKKSCLNCVYCDPITDGETISTWEQVMFQYFTSCSHVDICKRYIDDPGETISEYLNWEIGERG
nr:MAG TPA: hypothetical protein [Caudoviricetes sp.]